LNVKQSIWQIGMDTGKADMERMDNYRWPTQYRFQMDFS
jgi:hypothetical protein